MSRRIGRRNDEIHGGSLREERIYVMQPIDRAILEDIGASLRADFLKLSAAIAILETDEQAVGCGKQRFQIPQSRTFVAAQARIGAAPRKADNLPAGRSIAV